MRLWERVCWSGRTRTTEVVGAAKCSSRHGKPSRSAETGVPLLLFSSSAVGDVFTPHGASRRRCSRTHAAASDTTRRPCVRARARRDVDKRARADLAMSTRTAAAFHFRLQTRLRDEPSLTHRQGSARYGALAALGARLLVRPHAHYGGCRCSQVLITPREALTLGRDWCASSTLLVVGRRRCVHASRRVAAAALSHARGGFCHHPQAVRTRVRTDGRRQKSPCRFADVYSNRSGFPLPTPQNTLLGMNALTDRQKIVSLRICGFGSVLVGPAAPARRL